MSTESSLYLPCVYLQLFHRNNSIPISARLTGQVTRRPTVEACLPLPLLQSQQFSHGTTSCGDGPAAASVCPCSVSLYILHSFIFSSLANPHPLYLLLGDLAMTNQKARHVFSHKLWLARLPSNENAAYNLIGYLMSWEAGQDLLGQSLRSAMGVWSEGGAVRKMDSRQHMWLCRLLVLGTTCLASHLTPPTSTGDPLIGSCRCV